MLCGTALICVILLFYLSAKTNFINYLEGKMKNIMAETVQRRIFLSFFFFYCCARWGNIVAFAKVLTMYQI
jgi:hypothetical protein